MTSTEPARIFFIVARKRNKAIVLRRGPTQWTQMICWDLDTDALRYGQWLKKKVRPERCDLSPEGRYFIYLADRFEQGNSRTVLCKPPYWSALTAWEHGDPVFGSGGGLFTDEHSVVLNWHHPLSAHESWPAPPELKVGYFSPPGEYHLWKGQINLLMDYRMERDGWKRLNDDTFVEQETALLTQRRVPEFWKAHDPESSRPIEPQLWEKAITRQASLLMIRFYHSEDRKTHKKFYLARQQHKTELQDVEWADTDHRGRILAASKGRLFASKRSGDGSVQLENLVLLHDLNSQKPQYIKAPDGYGY